MSAVTKTPVLYELKDSGVYALTADGAAVSYGSKNDIPGIMSIELSAGETRTGKLMGDNRIHELFGRTLSRRVRVQHSAASWDVFAAITGATAATAGTTPNSTASYTEKGADEYPYFKIAGLIHKAKDFGTVNGANAVLTVYKCKLLGPPTTTFNEQGAVWQWEAEAIPTTADDKIDDITNYETATTLS